MCNHTYADIVDGIAMVTLLACVCVCVCMLLSKALKFNASVGYPVEP